MGSGGGWQALSGMPGQLGINWIGAKEVNLGTPNPNLIDSFFMDTLVHAVSDTVIVKIMRRDYYKAPDSNMVLFSAKVSWSDEVNGENDYGGDSTRVNVPLGGNYRKLNVDGNWGSVITEDSLAKTDGGIYKLESGGIGNRIKGWKADTGFWIFFLFGSIAYSLYKGLYNN